MKFTYSNSLPPPPKYLLELYIDNKKFLWPIDHNDPIKVYEVEAIYAFTGGKGGFMYNRTTNVEGLYEPQIL